MRITWIVLFANFAFAVLSVSAACSSSGQDPTIWPLFSSQKSGEATYYGAYTNGGHCSLDPTPPAGTSSGIFATVAIADNIWDNSAVCGLCINLTAKGTGSGGSPLGTGSYLVYVNNECPSCANNGIDLGLSGDGIWDITWTAVPCPVGSSNIQYLFQGANNYYIKLQARNTRYPVQGLSILQGSTWNALVRTADNFFQAGSSVQYPLVFPLTVKVTSTTGDSVQDTIPSLTNGVVIQGSAQFPDCGSSSSSSGSGSSTSSTSSTPTSTPTHPPTPSPTHAPPTSASLPVYTDSVLPPFQDWSWATVAPQTTSPKYAGTYSYGFIPISYQGAYFECSQCIDTSEYSAVTFYLYASSVPQIQFNVLQGGSPVGSTTSITNLIAGSFTANTWIKVSVSLPTSGIYDGFWLQDSSGASSASEIYLDEIYVVG